MDVGRLPMRVWTALLALSMLVAGCTAPEPTDPVHEADPSAPEADDGTRHAVDDEDTGPTEDAQPASPQPRAPSHPPLSSVDGARLHREAAAFEVPAGTYRLVRLVFDAGFWGESEPWDGDAEVDYAFAFRTEGAGTLMYTSGFAPSSWQEDQTYRPRVGFLPVEGDGWVGGWISMKCSGCNESVPRQEIAWLIGSPDADVTARLGALGSDEHPDALWEREPIPVRGDAQTQEAVGGVAVRSVILLEERQSVAGPVNASWGGTSTAAGTSVERTGTYRADVELREPGITSWSFHSQSAAGMDDWEYALEAPGLAGSHSDTWIHSPASGFAYGVIYPPQAVAQGNTAPGTLSFTARHSFTGQEDPIGYGGFTYEGVAFGHAGVDLDALYGWDTSMPSSPGEQQAWCMRLSTSPAVASCDGDPDLWPRTP